MIQGKQHIFGEETASMHIVPCWKCLKQSDSCRFLHFDLIEFEVRGSSCKGSGS